ncbi:flavin monoamine oxidase family protein [Qaidamihabitans albus]|uniref:flavin monoamine oxidase family protein n=1 Tax=Qaidamihabitans albus TaxID=2795733 RepID=UPI0018F20EEB|nr:FAD-dependent oxidoreductase [Qaidamihabitans albus]
MTVRRCQVVVAGAGLAGLTAADALTGAGADVRVLEAAPAVGGRVRGAAVSSGPVVDTGAEFVGHNHRRLRALLAELGLRTEPSGLGRAPVLWRLPGGSRVSRVPPVPVAELARLGRGWWRLRRGALALDPGSPWRSPEAAGLDESSLTEWLAARGVGRAGLDVTEAVLGGFATVPADRLSAAHAAWWIAAARGLLAALRSGQERIVTGGAHRLPPSLAGRLRHGVRTGNPVHALLEHARGVEVRTAEETWAADAAIVALPVPALRAVELDPAPPAPWRAAVEALRYGSAVKIAAVSTVPPPVTHRAVLGGHPLAVAWRHGRTLAGMGTTGAPTAADLAAAFGLRAGDLAGVVCTDWTREPHIGGSYLACAPGQLTGHVAALAGGDTRRIRFAGTERGGWPNSMEGAVRSGQAAARQVLGGAYGYWSDFS